MQSYSQIVHCQPWYNDFDLVEKGQAATVVEHRAALNINAKGALNVFGI